ncbi:thiamine pyrophosphate-dependent enzyme [Peptoniphilus duerdenii]|uniref:thiamine pyrophosphate-dependent enzyme n=1 Tax=Peptoniphilus duerdenii TaxID=507750 RepID=UPI00288A2784|nr:thiamine pyrophosphate-dependent enzyme [Peptoniphilus duerdenii]
MKNFEFNITEETQWCPGCGNPSIRLALKNALDELGLGMDDVIMSAGIGQAGKMPQYIDLHAFAGLHGRSLPVATAIKLANHKAVVIAEGGDGDGYGEGGNHLIHAIRRNINITQIVHNNQVYGLTKGQASPTTGHGQVQTFAQDGARSKMMKPLALALTLGAGFVARGFSGDVKQLTEIIKEALEFKGYALVDVLQPCITWNKVNTFKWYKERVKPLGEDYDNTNLDLAMEKAMMWGDEIPTGVLYKVESTTYEDQFEFLKDGEPMIDRILNPMDAKKVMDRMK